MYISIYTRARRYIGMLAAVYTQRGQRLRKTDGITVKLDSAVFRNSREFRVMRQDLPDVNRALTRGIPERARAAAESVEGARVRRRFREMSAWPRF